MQREELAGEGEPQTGARLLVVGPFGSGVPERDGAFEVGCDDRGAGGIGQMRLEVAVTFGLLLNGDVTEGEGMHAGEDVVDEADRQVGTGAVRAGLRCQPGRTRWQVRPL